jgi:hypothetical protein
MPDKRLKTTQVSLRLEPWLKAAAEEAAELDHRSLTSYIEVLILRDLEAKGLRKPKA